MSKSTEAAQRYARFSRRNWTLILGLVVALFVIVIALFAGIQIYRG